MSKITIREFSLRDGEKERKFLQQLPEMENGFGRPGKNSDLDTAENFGKFVKLQIDQSQGADLPDHYVPQTTFWILSDGELAGIGKVRHYLNDKLREHGGHIGLAVAPAFRSQGVGTEALRLFVEFARSLGQDKILVTIDENNAASRRAAEKNGGVLKKTVNGRCYYWI